MYVGGRPETIGVALINYAYATVSAEFNYYK